MRNLDQRWRMACCYKMRDQNGNFRKFKMAVGRHIENSFSDILRCHFDRFTWNLERRCRITYRHRSRDQSSNFRECKTADGRHFENSFIFISQPRIIQFRSNLVNRSEFRFRGWSFDKNWNCAISIWRSDAILNFILVYFGTISDDLCEICTADVKSHANTSQVTKTEIFENPTWRTAAMLKIVFRRLGICVIRVIKVIQPISIGVLVAMNLWKQEILYSKTAHSLSTFV